MTFLPLGQCSISPMINIYGPQDTCNPYMFFIFIIPWQFRLNCIRNKQADHLLMREEQGNKDLNGSKEEKDKGTPRMVGFVQFWGPTRQRTLKFWFIKTTLATSEGENTSFVRELVVRSSLVEICRLNNH